MAAKRSGSEQSSLITHTQSVWVCARIDSIWRRNSASGGSQVVMQIATLASAVDALDRRARRGSWPAAPSSTAPLAEAGAEGEGHRRGADPRQAPEAAAVAVGLVGAQRLQPRHPERAERLLLAVDEQHERLHPLAGREAGPGHEHRRARADAELGGNGGLEADVEGQSAAEPRGGPDGG